MFWDNKSAKEKEKKEKLSGPTQIARPMQNYLGRKELIVNNLSKLLGISLVISLLALQIAACKPWEAGYILGVTVDTPQDGTTVGSSPVTVSGTVNKTAEVKINDVVVPIKGGKFSTDIKLTEGSNVINVVATSGKDTVTKKVTITYNPSKQ